MIFFQVFQVCEATQPGVRSDAGCYKNLLKSEAWAPLGAFKSVTFCTFVTPWAPQGTQARKSDEKRTILVPILATIFGHVAPLGHPKALRRSPERQNKGLLRGAVGRSFFSSILAPT